MPTLNGVTYNTVWNDNFGSDQSLNHGIWSISWGRSDDFKFANGSLTLTSQASEGWSSTGFMRPDFNSGAGDGYGLYSATASLDKGQAGGICIDLWPANNQWPGAEFDLLESNDSSRNSGYATVHWKGSNGANDYSSTTIKVDLTQKNTFSVDWERGSETYYVNGHEVFRNTSQVPLDHADGGVNESFGAQVTSAKYGAVSSAVNLHLYDMSYAKASNAASVAPIQAAAKPAMRFLQGSGATVTLGAGAQATELGHANTLLLPAAGQVTLSGNILSDTLDLRAAMTASGWNHQMADIGKFLSSSTTAAGSSLSVHTASGGSVLTLALEGQHASLPIFEAHALLK
ncbi:glycoside hydrolase family 16 protein [Lichenicoccus sp.]|uniref:glycoside hydrolase family 16 protein n=1 Tax=Lichenicoccus sp. TaxID=2781899 RepID=UPI003D0A1C82